MEAIYTENYTSSGEISENVNKCGGPTFMY